ncbi:MAG: flagellar hook protein FlgE [Blastocatellia bacterium]|nr:flagellar hook protein FlgE [Blastocatellia bacterium]
MALTFSTALTGLRANAESLNTTGNNIANSNTTAYKTSSANFADLFHDSFNAPLNGAGLALQQGAGVRAAGIAVNFSQGTLSESGSALNAGIQGNGYFVLSSESGAQSYTRAGDFTLDREGYLVTPGGQKVQGYPATGGVIPPDAAPTSIKAPLGEFIAPSATSKAAFRMNLSAKDAVDSEFHSQVQIYDSKGVAHTLDLLYTKTGDGAYTVTATVDGNEAQLSLDGGGGGTSADLTFDENGQLTAPETLAVIADPTTLNGATMPDIDIALYTLNPDGTNGPGLITNYNATSAVAATEQNGFSSGTLAGLSFSASGNGDVVAVYNNGQTSVVGRLAVATFNSQDGLRQLGGNMFGETTTSGPPSIGAATTGGRGAVVGGVLEQSNVDIATEFTDLIIAQRGFQANSRVINTINQTLQDLIQIV